MATAENEVHDDSFIYKTRRWKPKGGTATHGRGTKWSPVSGQLVCAKRASDKLEYTVAYKPAAPTKRTAGAPQLGKLVFQHPYDGECLPERFWRMSLEEFKLRLHDPARKLIAEVLSTNPVRDHIFGAGYLHDEVLHLVMQVPVCIGEEVAPSRFLFAIDSFGATGDEHDHEEDAGRTGSTHGILGTHNGVIHGPIT